MCQRSIMNNLNFRDFSGDVAYELTMSGIMKMEIFGCKSSADYSY